MPRILPLLLLIATTCNAARPQMFEVESAVEFQKEEEAILLEEMRMMRQTQAKNANVNANANANANVNAVTTPEALNHAAMEREEAAAAVEGDSKESLTETETVLPVVNRNDDPPKQHQQQRQHQTLLRATREAFQREEQEAEQQHTEGTTPSRSRRLRTATTTGPQQLEQQKQQQRTRRTTTYLENLNQKTHSVAIQSFYQTTTEEPNRPLLESTGKRLNKVALEMLFEEELLEEMLEIAQSSMAR
ncbi:unnamed protein product [Cylindrotheca closterium]|uniref:Uncharacterized protein n=1 Tax=Cylindrotheca closterium TaxID=2856 RepID=A0AAD2FV31_9STRA|nr:unnamed protein product [Cylindrotheca closterium]